MCRGSGADMRECNPGGRRARRLFAGVRSVPRAAPRARKNASPADVGRRGLHSSQIPQFNRRERKARREERGVWSGCFRFTREVDAVVRAGTTPLALFEFLAISAVNSDIASLHCRGRGPLRRGIRPRPGARWGAARVAGWIRRCLGGSPCPDRSGRPVQAEGVGEAGGVPVVPVPSSPSEPSPLRADAFCRGAEARSANASRPVFNAASRSAVTP